MRTRCERDTRAQCTACTRGNQVVTQLRTSALLLHWRDQPPVSLDICVSHASGLRNVANGRTSPSCALDIPSIHHSTGIVVLISAHPLRIASCFLAAQWQAFPSSSAEESSVRIGAVLNHMCTAAIRSNITRRLRVSTVRPHTRYASTFAGNLCEEAHTCYVFCSRAAPYHYNIFKLHALGICVTVNITYYVCISPPSANTVHTHNLR
jgi:hypothetical protein